MVDIKLESINLNQVLSDVEKDIESDGIELGDLIIAAVYAEIITLVNSGKNSDNQPLAPYSPGYVKQRLAAGRSASPNLQFTSDMINSLTITKSIEGKLYKWVISPSGGDRSGVSNNDKMVYLEDMPGKNYTLLDWTGHLQTLEGKVIQRWSR